MAQYTFDTTGTSLLNVGGQTLGDDGLQLQFTVTGTNSIVLKKLTSPPGAAQSFTNVAWVNESNVLQSAGTAITASGVARISSADAANDIYLTLTATSGSVVVLTGPWNAGNSGGGGGGNVPAADVTAGTFGANSGETGAYTAPGALAATTTVTAGTALVSTTTTTVGTTLQTNGTTAALVQSATTADVNIGAGTGSGATTASIRGAAGQVRDLQWKTATTARWVARANATAESGSDAGSDWELLARTDAGAAIDTPVTIARAAGGVITLARGLRSAFGALFSSPTLGIGYTTGAGGAQTQATDKSTGVTSNTITTAITMNNANLAAATIVAFTFTNSTIAATDTVLVTHQSGGTSGAYTLNAFPGAGSAVISVRNNTAGGLAEAIVLRVTVIKSVSA